MCSCTMLCGLITKEDTKSRLTKLKGLLRNARVFHAWAFSWLDSRIWRSHEA